ncbi:selenocysteine lyase/cysteine desulfurase [Algoriphagus ratkowskyi]|uniref:Aminotransferase class V-fold PLP-dependent enzyme n=1 Tax=Algoriphagus ratkowskyi TaxID=57028 RepID=A0A2W7RHN2_9BACT|nr:aminotransferase class V-fold PLP-dependent enzyme [Algoriphagus ratkowskyi]PZX60408.1 selenocysteine lyase/cysteine desulfurase [Algoriphagus ratkowskyi]TXD78219.1 aminotransferase class V-fold PLP-dependent enzyme [Algoriphagus ratkowskyi]
MDSQKHLFSLDPDIHYLNCGYKGPLLKSAEQAGMDALIRERNPTNIKPEDFFNLPKEVKARFAELVNCDPLQVALIPSSSYGFATALGNITCEPGQHAIVLEDEFPSGYFSLKTWCDANTAILKVVGPDKDAVTPGESWNKKLLESITAETAVVLMSSVHWMNGLKFDLESIGQKCKTVGAIFVVDGTQSTGAAEMDVKRFKIDALICASYKWLLGPYGVGIAYYGPAFDGGYPLEESWMNRTNSQDFSNLTNYDHEYTEESGRYNVGEMSNFILLPMLNESLKQINEWTVPEIESYCRALTVPLYSYLKSRDFVIEEEQQTSYHLIGLKLPENIDADLLKSNLENDKISVSIRGGNLRVSVNVFNTSADIEKLIKTLEASRR